jgi:hypothetical protein
MMEARASAEARSGDFADADAGTDACIVKRTLALQFVHDEVVDSGKRMCICKENMDRSSITMHDEQTRLKH